MIGSLGNLMFKLHIIFVVNIKFPRVTYHTIVSSTEELLTPGGRGGEVVFVCSVNFFIPWHCQHVTNFDGFYSHSKKNASQYERDKFVTEELYKCFQAKALVKYSSYSVMHPPIMSTEYILQVDYT